MEKVKVKALAMTVLRNAYARNMTRAAEEAWDKVFRRIVGEGNDFGRIDKAAGNVQRKM